MKKIMSFVLTLTLIISVASNSDAKAYSAAAIAVYEPTNSCFLETHNADKKLPMASTTKIMTALVVLENKSLSEQIKIPDVAVGVEGSSMYLSKDESLTVNELLYGLMLTSGNDAAMALAYSVGEGSIDKFVQMMNDKSAQLQLENTHFTNPSGLPDDNHFTTAKELAILTAKALEKPTFAKIVSTKTIKIRKNGIEDGRTLENHNKLLFNYDGAIGVKTGFTKKAGRCLVSAATKDGVTLVCVTLNAPDDWRDHETALNKGFERTERVCLLEQGDITLALNTPDGTIVYAKNSAKLSFVSIDGKLPEKHILADKFVYAPKRINDVVGKISFISDGKEIASADLLLDRNLDAPVKKELFITEIIKFIRNIFKWKNS